MKTEIEKQITKIVTKCIYKDGDIYVFYSKKALNKTIKDIASLMEEYANTKQVEPKREQVDIGICNHVIGANDSSGICIKCGKKVCEIINNDLCEKKKAR
jgi:hypothetical protein